MGSDYSNGSEPDTYKWTILYFIVLFMMLALMGSLIYYFW
jgi:hypothetical protein